MFPTMMMTPEINLPFSSPGKVGTNIQLKVGNETFNVCKEVLATVSEYFEKMFLGGYMEKNKTLIELKDESAEDMRCFLEAAIPHPGLKPIEDATLENLLRLGDKYQASNLKEQCAQFITYNNNRFTADHSLKLLICAINYNLNIDSVIHSLLPATACLSLDTIRSNQLALGDKYYNKLVTHKCYRNYDRVKDCSMRGKHFVPHALKLSDSNLPPLPPILQSCGPHLDFSPQTNECQCEEARRAYVDLMRTLGWQVPIHYQKTTAVDPNNVNDAY